MTKAKGFGKVSRSILTCEAMLTSFPSNQKFTAYQNGKKIFVDFEEILKIYGVDPNDPELRTLEVVAIRPKGSHPETGLRTGITMRGVIDFLRIAIEKGSLEGRIWASKDVSAIAEESKRQAGVSHEYVENGKLTPIAQNGKKVKHLTVALNESELKFLYVFNNNDLPFFQGMTEKLGCNFYGELIQVAARRVKSLKTNHEIAAYVGNLLYGLTTRNPEVSESGYLKVLGDFLLEDFSSDRKQLIIAIMMNADSHRLEQPDFLFDDLMAALGRFAQDSVTGPNQSERVLVKDDLVLLDQVWQGANRFTAMIEALDRHQKQNQKDSETDNAD